MNKENRKQSHRLNKRLKLISRLLFLVYLAFTLYFMFFSEGMGRTIVQKYKYNLEPFVEIKRFYNMLNNGYGIKAYINLFGNVICFIPFGMFLPSINEKYRVAVKVIILAFLFSLIIETTQLYFMVGIFDVDDLMLNTLGGLIGYILYKIYRWFQYGN